MKTGSEIPKSGYFIHMGNTSDNFRVIQTPRILAFMSNFVQITLKR